LAEQLTKKNAHEKSKTSAENLGNLTITTKGAPSANMAPIDQAGDPALVPTYFGNGIAKPSMSRASMAAIALSIVNANARALDLDAGRDSPAFLDAGLLLASREGLD
jgi:hypothetical protein